MLTWLITRFEFVLVRSDVKRLTIKFNLSFRVKNGIFTRLNNGIIPLRGVRAFSLLPGPGADPATLLRVRSVPCTTRQEPHIPGGQWVAAKLGVIIHSSTTLHVRSSRALTSVRVVTSTVRITLDQHAEFVFKFDSQKHQIVVNMYHRNVRDY